MSPRVTFQLTPLPHRRWRHLWTVPELLLHDDVLSKYLDAFSNKFVLFFRSLLSSFKRRSLVLVLLLLHFSLYSCWPLMVVWYTRHLLVVVHTYEVQLLLLGLAAGWCWEEEGVREPFAGCCVLKKARPPFQKQTAQGLWKASWT